MSEQGRKNEVPNLIVPPANSAHRHFRFGAITSIAYAGSLAVYSWQEWSDLLAMTPDQFATFLSGAFAPLAFLWLVLGFRQQGDELQNSARALWLQGEELRNSVEQQRQLVEVSREQLASEREQRMLADREADLAAQPRFVITLNSVTTSGQQITFQLQYGSAGPTCTDLTITANGELSARVPLMGAVQGYGLGLTFQSQVEIVDTHFEFCYLDARGNRRSQCFLMTAITTSADGQQRTLGQPTPCFESPHNWSASK